MCLITDDKTLYVAEEDIITYKVVRETLEPQIQSHMRYVLGELNETIMLHSTNPKYPSESAATWVMENIGVAKITDSRGIIDLTLLLSYDNILVIGQGFHSYADIDNERIKAHNGMVKRGWNFPFPCCVVECTIPKGAEYHKSPYGHIVSNKIIINRVLEPQTEEV